MLIRLPIILLCAFVSSEQNGNTQRFYSSRARSSTTTASCTNCGTTITEPTTSKPKSHADLRMFHQMVEYYLLSNLDSEVSPTWSNHTSAPDYMIRLYQYMTSKKQKNIHWKSSPREAIRGYYIIDEKSTLQNLVFNVSCQPLNETITHVELVLSRCSSTLEPFDPTGSSQLKSIMSDVNMTVSMAMDGSQPIDSVFVQVSPRSNSSFYVINVTDMVLQSFALKKTILNFTIESSLLLNPQNHSCLFERTNRKCPLLVIYENIEPFNISSNNLRKKRRVQLASESPLQDTTTRANGTINASTTPPSNSSESVQVNCHLTSWYVSFVEIGWHNIIYAPVGYNANYCSGKCPTNLEQINSTNHALMRSKYAIVATLDPSIPAPFCVPIQTSALTVLYRNKHNVTISKRFGDMVAVQCACL
ncbi:bone morphogenetic protein 2-A-like isoform X1 [Octopus sinensis]|uniref:Bone morphogenetic protein 2-A-like isoform X1 n=1 Tax=Octopus sinensis TaxID=2607531 RepID=A0A6P7U7J4_9MOLL|nr:bone morphogenetic protein 2-A-like isoform X1 [Octopus sinensis]